MISLITTSDYLQSENVDILMRTLTITSNLVHAAGKEYSKPRQHSLFKILLQITSNPMMGKAQKHCD
jgi:hypothetical protein